MTSWVAYANFRCGCPTAEAWKVCCAFLSTRPAIRKAGNHRLPNDPSKCNVWASARSLPHSSVTWVLLSYKVMTGGLSSWQYNLSTGDLYRYDHKVLNRNFFKEKKKKSTDNICCCIPPLITSSFYFFGEILPRSVSAGPQSFSTEVHKICLWLRPGPEGTHAIQGGRFWTVPYVARILGKTQVILTLATQKSAPGPWAWAG